MLNAKLIVLYVLILRAVNNAQGLTRSEYGAVMGQARAKVWGEIALTPLEEGYRWSNQDFERAVARLTRLGLLEVVRGDRRTKSSITVVKHATTLDSLRSLRLSDQATYAWLVLQMDLDPGLTDLYIIGASRTQITLHLREYYPQMARRDLADLAAAVLELNDAAGQLVAPAAKC